MKSSRGGGGACSKLMMQGCVGVCAASGSPAPDHSGEGRGLLTGRPMSSLSMSLEALSMRATVSRVPLSPTTAICLSLCFLLVTLGLLVLSFKQAEACSYVTTDSPCLLSRKADSLLCCAASVLPSIPGNSPASSGLQPTPTLPPHLCNRCINTFFLNSFLPPTLHS